MAALKYRAFISFSHESDERLAAALQSSLSRFAKPWYRTRSMRVFQDAASLAANPALWNSIEQALTQSEYLLLLASPASAKSRWVQQEVQWWLANRSVDKLVICLTDGTILWDNPAGAFDWDKTTAIPVSLQHAFAAEPLYADFRGAKAGGELIDSDPRFRAALLDVAAPLMGRPKDEIDSEDLRQHRRAQRTAVAAVAFIAVLGLIAGVAGNLAQQRQKTAASRALASEAASPHDDRSLAMLLAIESRRIADTVESRRALLSAIQRVPHAEAFLWGHTDAVSSAVFSPDGQTIVSSGWDDRVLMWNSANHQLVGEPIKTAKSLVGVAFSPDGSQFAAAAGAGIFIWDTASRRAVGAIMRANEEFVRVAFSANGKLLAASTAAYGAHPARVYVWTVTDRSPVGEPLFGSDFSFSPDGALLAIVQHQDLMLYDLRAHRLIGSALAGHSKEISAVVFSGDGTVVAAGSEDKTIVLWDLKSRRPIGTLAGHADTVTSLLFDAKAQFLYSGSRDGTVIKWDLDNLEAADLPVNSIGASIASIFITADGRVTSLALDKERVVLFDVNDDPPLGRRFKAPGSHESTIAFSPDGRFLASAAEFGEIALWDVARAELDGMPMEGHDRQVSSLVYAPNGKQLISASIDGSIIFWDMNTRTALGPSVQTDRSPVWSLACSPDGKTVVAGGDARLAFWDLATRQRRGSASTSQKDRIWALAFSPDGTLLASAGNKLETALWKSEQPDVPTKTLGSAPPKEEFELMPAGVSFNPNGTLLATSTLGHSVSLWNVKTGQPLLPLLYGHAQSVSSMAFSGDGSVLASGSADGDIRLWDVPTHELIGTLGPRQKAIRSIALEPAQEILASVDEDDNIVLWNVRIEDWIKRACRTANRNLSSQEWSTFLGKSPFRKTCPDLT